MKFEFSKTLLSTKVKIIPLVKLTLSKFNILNELSTRLKLFKRVDIFKLENETLSKETL